MFRSLHGFVTFQVVDGHSIILPASAINWLKLYDDGEQDPEVMIEGEPYPEKITLKSAMALSETLLIISLEVPNEPKNERSLRT